ncbi:MAG: hypothetical protein GEU90_19775 [Gemmatimonas sp.]|nr:hypothetical protein [Gemmatimonas sp.]
MTLSVHLRRIRSLCMVALGGCAPITAGSNAAPLPTSYRIFDVSAEQYVSLARLAEDMEGVDALFFGEFHDDQAVHGAQQELLEVLAAGDREVVLGLEMFERDVQPMLDRYLRGESGEADFLRDSRPWPNYRTDYRPLVELVRVKGWSVLATNLPQGLATAIARGGLAALESVPAAERLQAASRIECPQDDYWVRFVEAITGGAEGAAHAGAQASDPMMRRVFEAQCVRDETMAEAVAPIMDSEPLLFHVNGSFHTDHFLGIVPRLLRRQPDAVVRVIATVQLPELVNPDLTEHQDKADYLILTLEPPEG